jgi:flavorubredoxin
MRKLPILNRGYLKVLTEIHHIMINQEIAKMYEDFLEVTEGDKGAAATLVLASIRQQTEKAIEKVTEGVPEVGSFGTIDKG